MAAGVRGANQTSVVLAALLAFWPGDFAGAQMRQEVAPAPTAPQPEGTPPPSQSDYGGTGPLRYIDHYGVPGVGKVAPPSEVGPAQPVPSTETPGTPAAPPAVVPPSGVEPEGKGKPKKPAKRKAKKKRSKVVVKKAAEPEISTAQAKYDPLRDTVFLIEARRYDEALKEVNKVLAADPVNAEAHYLKAVVAVYLRRYSDAADEYNEVLRLSPPAELAERAREGLKKLLR